ncbi:MAG: hypothetical protein Q4D61_00600 [Cardiobacteriaceae bacterium]|nr:hypothetical protein [Cardiobacteriaceae bacterium]
MGQIQNYYRILGLEATATASEIQDAIQKMRAIDSEGNYSAILNKIEKTLLPRNRRAEATAAPAPEPAPRAKPAAPPPMADEPEVNAATELYDDFSFETPRRIVDTEEKAHRSAFGHDMDDDMDDIPEKHQSGFLDFGEREYLTEPQRKRNFPVKDTRTYITEEEIRAYNKPPSFLAKLFSGKTLILAVLAIGVGVAGVIFGLPAYNLYLANKQSEAAVPVLHAARDDVESQLRRNRFFPETLSRDFGSDHYTVRLNAAKEALELTFNHNAADNLQGHSLILESYVAPNIGLQWRCDVSPGYPQNLRPAQCF